MTVPSSSRHDWWRAVTHKSAVLISESYSPTASCVSVFLIFQLGVFGKCTFATFDVSAAARMTSSSLLGCHKSWPHRQGTACRGDREFLWGETRTQDLEQPTRQVTARPWIRLLPCSSLCVQADCQRELHLPRCSCGRRPHDEQL